MRHAIVNSLGLVVNVIALDGAKWTAPENHLVIQSDSCDIGDRYDFKNRTFTKFYDIEKKDITNETTV